MSGLECSSPTSEYLRVFREHVHSPVEEARRRARKEQTELGSEINAFTEFAHRVEEIASNTSQDQPLRVGAHTGSNSLEQVRTAYRDTVLSLSHFETRYDESLTENIKMEFSQDIFTVFASDLATFTPLFKQRLLHEIRANVANRQNIAEKVDAEVESLCRAEARLANTVDETTPSRIPLCTDALTGRLESLITMRQQHLCQSSATDAVDGHDLCDYLYAEKSWTYPVLVAVCRFREAAVQ